MDWCLDCGWPWEGNLSTKLDRNVLLTYWTSKSFHIQTLHKSLFKFQYAFTSTSHLNPWLSINKISNHAIYLLERSWFSSSNCSQMKNMRKTLSEFSIFLDLSKWFGRLFTFLRLWILNVELLPPINHQRCLSFHF